MIFYFSGTGNSEWAARQLAARLGDETRNIIDISADERFRFGQGEVVGLAFPVYAWRAPDLVTEFAARIETVGAYTYAVCTCESEAGNTLEILNRAWPLSAGFSVDMPSNYIIGPHDTAPDADNVKRLREAASRLDVICGRIRNRETGFEAAKGSWPRLKSNLINWLFNKKGRKTAPFHVTVESCISCGLCVKICPTRTIELRGGRPVWRKEACALCLGCINRCPQLAIEYGNKTQGKKRYYCKGL